MAKKLQQRIKFDIGSVVTDRIEAYKKSRGDLQVADELKFFRDINEKGLSVSDQLAFRQAQLDREQQRSVPDLEYVLTIKKEIATLKKASRYEKIRNFYKDSLLEVTQQKKSWESHLELLKNQLKDTNDPDMQAELRTEIQNTTKSITDANNALLENSITAAKTDKSVPLLEQTIESVKNEKAKALGAGDNVRAQAMDLKLQGLTQTLTEVKIQNKSNEILMNKSRKASAISYMQSLNQAVDGADSASPIVIGGVRYASEKEYWQDQRNKYLSSNFFDDLSKEYNAFSDSVAAVSGKVTDVALRNIQSDFTQLSSDPNITPYLNRLEMTRVGVLDKAITLTSNAVFNQYVIDKDFNKALSTLENLEKTYGISTTAASQKIVEAEAKERADVSQNILAEVQAGVASGLSYSAASKKVFEAINTKSGKFVSPSYSPQELTSNKPEDIVANAPGKTKEQVGAPVPTPTGVPPATTPTQPQGTKPIQTPGQAAGATTPAPEPTPPAPPPSAGQPVNTPVAQNIGFSEFVVRPGDTLSKIARETLGDAKAFTKIFEANKDILSNPNLIKPGQKLKIPKA